MSNPRPWEQLMGPAWTLADELDPTLQQRVEVAQAAPPLLLADALTLYAHGLHPQGPVWLMETLVDNPVVQECPDDERVRMLRGVYYLAVSGRSSVGCLALAVDKIYYDRGLNQQQMRLWLAPLPGSVVDTDTLPTTDVRREGDGFRLAWVTRLVYDKYKLQRALPTATRALEAEEEALWTQIKNS